jgi:cell wall-associated NlpC family hydrolase
VPLRRFVTFAVVGTVLGSLAAGSASADPSTTELDRQIRAATQALEATVEEYNELREDLRVTVAQSRVLAEQVMPLERRVDQLRDRIGVIAVTAYKTAGVTGTNALLTAASAEDFVRRLGLLEELARQRQGEIAELHRARDAYIAARRTVEALATQERDQERDLAARKASIEAEIARLRTLRVRAYGEGERAARNGLRDYTVPPAPKGVLGSVVRFAAGQLGKAYRFAADGPDSYDCSGLVVAAYRAVGVMLPHSSRQQWDRVQRIGRADLRPGDLVFYYSDIHHVGIYVGADKVIHAPQYGEPVRVDSIDSAPIHGYGRPH